MSKLTTHVPHGCSATRSRLTQFLLGLLLMLLTASVCAAASQPWLVLRGASGPGVGKHIVLVSGDEEYRSEEAIPMLAKILAGRHGFQCTVLFALNRQSGEIDPNVTDNSPGLQALETADLMVVFTRFRELPDDQMQYVDAYLRAGKPVAGIRPSVVAFRNRPGSRYVKYSSDYRGTDYADGFGQQVLGSTWISHHGAHGKEGTRGLVVQAMKSHPILRGVEDIWGPSDVYTIRQPIPEGGQILVMGQAARGRTAFTVAWTHF